MSGASLVNNHENKKLKNFLHALAGILHTETIERSLSPALRNRLNNLSAYVSDFELINEGMRYKFIVHLYCEEPVDGTILLASKAIFEQLDFVKKMEFKLSFPSECLINKNLQATHLMTLFEWVRFEARRVGLASISMALENCVCTVADDRLILNCNKSDYRLLTDDLMNKFIDFVKSLTSFDCDISLKVNSNSENESESNDIWDAAIFRRVEALREEARSIEERRNLDPPCEHNHVSSSPDLSSISISQDKREMMYDYGRNKWIKQGSEGVIWGRYPRDEKFYKIEDITIECGRIVISGYVHKLELRPIRNGKSILYKFAIFSDEGAIRALAFVDANKSEELLDFKEGGYYSFFVDPNVDSYSNEVQVRVNGIRKIDEPAKRKDEALEKRIELHCHTNMSARDALSDINKLIELAASFGHKAVAITDHGVVQAFPQAKQCQNKLAAKGINIDLLFGMEGYLVDDGVACVYGPDLNEDFGDDFVEVQIDTTGDDISRDQITKITAKRYIYSYEQEKYIFEDSFEELCRPLNMPNSEFYIGKSYESHELEMARDVHSVILDFAEYLSNSSILALDALKVLAFLRYEGMRVKEKYDVRQKFNPVLIDLAELWAYYKERTERLQDIASGLSTEGKFIFEEKDIPDLLTSRIDYAHSRAFVHDDNDKYAYNEIDKFLDESRALLGLSDDELGPSDIFISILDVLNTRSGAILNKLCGKLDMGGIKSRSNKARHIIFLAKDSLGLYNLYRLVSESNIHFFQFRPKCPRSLLKYFRAGITVGAACEAGEIFKKILEHYQNCACDYARARKELENSVLYKLADFYDYLEIQPLGNNAFLLRKEGNGINEYKQLEELNLLIVDLAKLKNMPFVATCDSHFLEKEDGKFRSVILDYNGMNDVDEPTPLYFRTTEEMFDEFKYLSDEDRYLAIIKYPHMIAAEIDGQMEPFPSGSYPPEIKSAPDDVRKMVYDEAERLYAYKGVLPEIVQSRVERELKAIIDNGFSIMYYIAHHLVKKSNDDGYLVGSRGSVGSSLVATLCKITEVNPLPPHYRCPNCRYSEFDSTGEYGSGYDLPQKNCPHCGHDMYRDGQDIPFETFLGFDGDKQPDIDLNFSGEYQMYAHEFIRKMFGEKFTFRAGTVTAFQEKNCLTMARKYAEKRGQTVNSCELERIADRLTGVKSTTGQHPGGIVVIPKERDIYDFTPIQYPADKADSNFCTTHYDFNSLHDTILKLDVLGHDDPTMLRVLADLTGKNILDIPVPDEDVMKLFTGTEVISIENGTGPAEIGSLGLPEMGTFMARGMIQDIKPKRFYDLVQLLGLSHGTDVWKGNAQDLILDGTCTINDVIGCRDSIMTTLIYWGLPKKDSFDIMEKVRKGKGLSEYHENLMREKAVPEWYIDSCKKIKYMFPKAHAVAYAISALRIAWFKVHIPEAWYCAWFSIRSKVFKAQKMCRPIDEIKSLLSDIKTNMRNNVYKESEKKNIEKEFYCLEIVLEMYLRNIAFSEIDLYKSEASIFTFEEQGLVRPSLDSIDGVSTANAEKIVAARKQRPFISKEDLQKRAALPKVAMEQLEILGVLKDLPDSDQIDIMSLLG